MACSPEDDDEKDEKDFFFPPGVLRLAGAKCRFYIYATAWKAGCRHMPSSLQAESDHTRAASYMGISSLTN